MEQRIGFMDLSIIIPVYNVEKYIRSCLESVFRQGLDDDCFEIIMVNDGTCDNSFQTIEDIILLHSNIHIIEQPNLGLGVARNNGLIYANGKYVLFVDSDDLLVDNSLQKILHFAVGSDADIVSADYLEIEDDCVPHCEINYEVLEMLDMWEGTSFDFFLYKFDGRSFVWRNLYKRQFLNCQSIRFVPNICFEDILFNTECVLKSHKCLKISTPLYVYRQRYDSFVHQIDKKKMKDLNYVISCLWEFEKNYRHLSKLDRRLKDFIFDTFSFYLWYMISYNHLFKERREIIRDLKDRVPNLFFNNNMKQIIISFMFKIIPCQYIFVRRGFDVLTKMIRIVTIIIVTQYG